MNKRLISLLSAALILLTAVIIPASEAKAINVTLTSTPISGGSNHSVAIQKNSSLWVWGSNLEFQLGKEAEVKKLAIPEQVVYEDTDASIVAVAAGSNFSLALDYYGDVYVLGRGGNTPIYKVPALTGIVAIAAGSSVGLALDNEGAVWQWDIGRSPKRISNLSGVAEIAAGSAHFLALTFSGEVWAWGINGNGQLGNGTTNDTESPRKVETLANIVGIAAGNSHTLAISHDGSIYAWGSNTFGQLGDGTTDAHNTPVKTEGIKNAIAVSAGVDSSMALTKDKKIFTWGYGEYGQHGNGDTVSTQEIPKSIETEGVPVFIASGAHHNFYVSSEGNLYTWGRNRDNQLGNGNDVQTTKPVKVLNSLPTNNTRYLPLPFQGASTWAVQAPAEELPSLYALELLPPMLWGRYQTYVTRAEFAGLLVNIYEAIKGKTITYPDKTNFEDISKNVYETEIRKAYEIKLVNGVSETLFNPEGRIYRQDAAKMICTFIFIMEGITEDPDVTILPYKDVAKISKYAIPFVSYAYEYNIITGTGSNFEPMSNLTREQTLAIIYRAIMKYGWV